VVTLAVVRSEELAVVAVVEAWGAREEDERDSAHVATEGDLVTAAGRGGGGYSEEGKGAVNSVVETKETER